MTPAWDHQTLTSTFSRVSFRLEQDLAGSTEFKHCTAFPYVVRLDRETFFITSNDTNLIGTISNLFQMRLFYHSHSNLYIN